ncbi:MAG: hypothetical protein ABJN26_13195 [Stappiaceae bacterium]
MSMLELVQVIEEQGKGVRAYSECARICQERLNTHPDQAAGYYLLKIAANRFVDAYDDQPLLSQTAEDEFQSYKHYADQLEPLHVSSDLNEKLDAVNRVAALIANHKHLRSSV